MPYLSPTTLTTDEQKLILRVTAKNIRDHTIFSMALAIELHSTDRDKSSPSDPYLRSSRWRGRPRVT